MGSTGQPTLLLRGKYLFFPRLKPFLNVILSPCDFLKGLLSRDGDSYLVTHAAASRRYLTGVRRDYCLSGERLKKRDAAACKNRGSSVALSGRCHANSCHGSNREEIIFYRRISLEGAAISNQRMFHSPSVSPRVGSAFQAKGELNRNIIK